MEVCGKEVCVFITRHRSHSKKTSFNNIKNAIVAAWIGVNVPSDMFTLARDNIRGDPVEL